MFLPWADTLEQSTRTFHFVELSPVIALLALAAFEVLGHFREKDAKFYHRLELVSIVVLALADVVVYVYQAHTDDLRTAKEAPRRLTAEQKDTIRSAVAGMPRAIMVESLLDQETQTYADDFREAFASAGWTVQPPAPAFLNHAPFGVALVLHDIQHPPNEAVPLQRALRSVGVFANGMAAPDHVSDGAILLFVGPKPL